MKLSAIDNTKSSSKMADLLSASKSEQIRLYRGNLVEGVIVNLTDNEVVLDLGAKCEGILSKRELPSEQFSSLKIGDNLEAYVLIPENESGQAVLTSLPAPEKSSGNINQIKKFQKIISAYRQKSKLIGKVVDMNKGGLMVEVATDKGGIRGFIPASQLSWNVFDGPNLTDKSVKLEVLEVDPANGRAIFSSYQEVTKEEKEKLLSLKTGSKVQAKVLGVFPFGVWVEVEDLDGMILPGEISWEKVEDQSSKIKEGETIEVVVLGTDERLGRVNLSLKRLEEDPFEKLVEDYQVDDVVSGEVLEITSTGVVIKLNKDITGFIPTEKVSSEKNYEVGQSTNFLVDSIDKAKRRVVLAPFITSTVGLIYK